MEETTKIMFLDQLAFRSGSHYYPFALKKKIHHDGEETYAIEMKVGNHYILVTDASTLEEVLKRHEKLVRYAVKTRHLQRRPI